MVRGPVRQADEGVREGGGPARAVDHRGERGVGGDLAVVLHASDADIGASGPGHAADGPLGEGRQRVHRVTGGRDIVGHGHGHDLVGVDVGGGQAGEASLHDVEGMGRVRRGARAVHLQLSDAKHDHPSVGVQGPTRHGDAPLFDHVVGARGYVRTVLPDTVDVHVPEDPEM